MATCGGNPTSLPMSHLMSIGTLSRSASLRKARRARGLHGQVDGLPWSLRCSRAIVGCRLRRPGVAVVLFHAGCRIRRRRRMLTWWAYLDRSLQECAHELDHSLGGADER